MPYDIIFRGIISFVGGKWNVFFWPTGTSRKCERIFFRFWIHEGPSGWSTQRFPLEINYGKVWNMVCCALQSTAQFRDSQRKKQRVYTDVHLSYEYKIQNRRKYEFYLSKNERVWWWCLQGIWYNIISTQILKSNTVVCAYKTEGATCQMQKMNRQIKANEFREICSELFVYWFARYVSTIARRARILELESKI